MIDIITPGYLLKCGAKEWMIENHHRFYFDKGYYDVNAKKFVDITDDRMAEIEKLYTAAVLEDLVPTMHDKTFSKKEILNINAKMIKLLDEIDKKDHVKVNAYTIAFIHVKTAKGGLQTVIKYIPSNNNEVFYIVRNNVWGV